MLKSLADPALCRPLPIFVHSSRCVDCLEATNSLPLVNQMIRLHAAELMHSFKSVLLQVGKVMGIAALSVCMLANSPRLAAADSPSPVDAAYDTVRDMQVVADDIRW
jgi:hypothetical protein